MSRKIKREESPGATPAGSTVTLSTHRLATPLQIAAGILFTLTSASAFAVDTDGDGVDNNLDNCITVANADQRDTNGNQIGNVCDADFNGDGIVDAFDIPLFRTAFGQSTFPNEDMNGDGIVDAFDIPLFRAAFGNPPGPSCAGLFYGCVAPLDPLAIPKYVLPLVIPPAMNPVGGPGGAPDNYEIAVKQFQQQILPGGHWNAVSAKCCAIRQLCDLPRHHRVELWSGRGSAA